MATWRTGFLGPVVGASVALPILLSGCGGTAADYQLLQNAIQDHITNVDHRPVNAVACTPHVDGTVRGETARLRCLVRFKDGSSYTANAIIQNENTGGAHNLPDQYSWDSPPVKSP